MLATLVLLGAALAVIVYVLQPKQTQLPKGTQLPSGPPGKPLVGNLLDIPPKHSWFRFLEWSKWYGPLYSLNLAGQKHVVISTEDIANDLLRERGNLYSSRMNLPMATELLSRNLRPLLLPYGDTWRNGRKLMHNLANVSVATTYEPMQEEESIRAVRDLLRAPEKYETWFERYSAGLILRLAYSRPVVTGEEPFVRDVLAVVHTVERVASPGAYLVDTFPILMYLPYWLAPFKREGARLHNAEITLFRNLLDEGVKVGQAHPAPRTSARRGTRTGKLMTCRTTMWPEFTKLQQEIDKVVGADRVPSFSDMAQLPRVRAVVKEVLRWRPVTAGGLPHMLVKDDTYEMPDGRSVFLEAGTAFHPVQWSIHREAKLNPEPDEFRPERWLEPGWPTYREPLTKFPNLQNYSAFGFGRRICPGLNIAERSLYILVSRVAWSCEISYQKTAAGDDIVPPSYDYVSGFNVQPKPFPFALKPRQQRAEVVEREYQKAWGGGERNAS
ncbi:hypothetical protein LTR94_008238 [Friedmanniomyces endolithicus]|nr:hypothetical protein LTR94_008238 [Friedmanniomyces endolithicus]KAK0815733.1 hypothetical protein LTR38_002380 [Friedmanniomyces endolithicus]